jgi:hypothetical protein
MTLDSIVVLIWYIVVLAQLFIVYLSSSCLAGILREISLDSLQVRRHVIYSVCNITLDSLQSSGVQTSWVALTVDFSP